MQKTEIEKSGILSNQGIDRNFKTLILEVQKQVQNTREVLDQPDGKRKNKILSRDDYIDNLKSLIENKCFYSNLKGNLEKRDVDLIRAINIITSNLEHIADYSVNIISQLHYLDDPLFLHNFEYKPLFDEVTGALKLVEKSLRKRDINQAFKICRSEQTIDSLFAMQFKKIMDDLRKGRNIENLVTTLFILRYLERMGDQMLNIGEAIIFAGVGEKLKISHIEALEDSMEGIDIHGPITNLSIESFLETKSGCRINRIQGPETADQETGVIFKEGQIDKLEQENKNIRLWEKIKPGLPPRVFGFNKNGKSASILLEFLNGTTLQKALLESNRGLLDKAMNQLTEDLEDLWLKSKNPQPVQANFINQTSQRIEDIFHTHPDFKLLEKQIGSHRTLSLPALLEQTQKIEEEIGGAPFSVLIHGDFNIDNVLFNEADSTIHFIDLHRSKPQDYVQDISVFILSNFRLPVFVNRIRKNINNMTLRMFCFGRNFAKKQKDPTYEARLALGLIRSFTTSTRFEFNKEFASTMLLRAVYLMEKLMGFRGKPWAQFRLPQEVLSY
ncbi:MAG: phosphotransferase [Candidatus Nitronauta litoralis]|uniref:Phosphotransferase n=1 Tax=Candidatus Nitronauta litoralis TaxID=2705533 RepID=A0A7T0BWZ5_9BACT|nr:MAG: phosphotransferase [Candidatus Nitronauta litoralis]